MDSREAEVEAASCLRFLARLGDAVEFLFAGGKFIILRIHPCNAKEMVLLRIRRRIGLGVGRIFSLLFILTNFSFFFLFRPK